MARQLKTVEALPDTRVSALLPGGEDAPDA
jgi:hypothetical protein